MRVLLIIIMLVPSLGFAGQNCPLNGYWKSHEKKTLESLSKAKNVTEKQQKIFGSDFFGKLVMFVECGQFTSALEGWGETTRYETISTTRDKVVIQYIEFPDDKDPTEKEIHLHGGCYSVPINGGQFREYMCSSSQSAFNKQRNTDSGAERYKD